MTDWDWIDERQADAQFARGCSRPYHCPCGCGSHGECFFVDYEDEETSTREQKRQRTLELIDHHLRWCSVCKEDTKNEEDTCTILQDLHRRHDKLV